MVEIRLGQPVQQNRALWVFLHQNSTDKIGLGSCSLPSSIPSVSSTPAQEKQTETPTVS